ncbi:MAG TPA: hypothetical protein VNT26_17795, partial [Candidatus Sulfotelmatobacter sp.]|nr:hypothetical protein [Candidatus Sulfotelmatobacter sp.]
MSEGTLQDCSKGRFLPVSPASQASPGATPRGCNRWLIVVLLAQVLAWIAAAQSPLPDAFKPGINGEVYALAVQADGKILVGGSFTWLDGQTCSNLARLNPDGTLDSSFFAPQPSGAVRALAVQADGKIVVGGRYAVLGGRWRENLARLNPDGTLEAGFRPSTSGEVRALAVQADGKIVVGGYFNSLNGPWCAGIGRLNADGTLETAFGYDLNPVEVSAVAVQADGKILMGGAFARDIGGFYRYRIARWNADGRLDETFNPGDFSHNSAAVETVAVQPDGKILLGGTFTNLAGHACYRIARLYASGAFESSFGLGADDSVSAFALQADGGIIVAGSFTTMDGQPRNRLARFNADGTLDNTFNPGASGPVKALAVQADGKVLLSGTFTSLAGQSRTNLARLNSAAPALRNLARGVSDINWQRGGTSPEVWRTLFEQSIDGVTWTGLGAGSRVAGGWQITGVSTAPNATIRARGFVIGGRDNGSGWLVEDYCGAPLLLNPPASQQVNA